MRVKQKYPQKCPFCGYEWEGRKKKPKQCPLCKRYLIKRGALKKKGGA